MKSLTDLYSSPNTVWVIKSRRMRGAGHIARMGERRGIYKVLVGKPERKKSLGRPRHRWIFRKWDVGVWSGSGWYENEFCTLQDKHA